MAAEEVAAADFAATAARTGLPLDGWTTVGAWSDEVAHRAPPHQTAHAQDERKKQANAPTSVRQRRKKIYQGAHGYGGRRHVPIT